VTFFLYPLYLRGAGFLAAKQGLIKGAARRLALALYWMWRKGWNYEQLRKLGSHAGKLGNRLYSSIAATIFL
jgi:hypothetical protein